MVITGSNFIDNDMGWIRANLPGYEPSVEIRDVTEDYACIGMWGPRARDVLQTVTEDDVSNAAFPFMTARTIISNGVSVLAQQVSYVGELCSEFYPPGDKAMIVWDKLWDVGQKFGRPGHQLPP
ncbi:MAG: aminomethyl transferase family protein [Desulfobacterales bacterium]|nr:aminomethyl transferase family protein [Desulfobacterales bacterium]